MYQNCVEGRPEDLSRIRKKFEEFIAGISAEYPEYTILPDNFPVLSEHLEKKTWGDVFEMTVLYGSKEVFQRGGNGVPSDLWHCMRETKMKQYTLDDLKSFGFDNLDELLEASIAKKIVVAKQQGGEVIYEYRKTLPAKCPHLLSFDYFIPGENYYRIPQTLKNEERSREDDLINPIVLCMETEGRPDYLKTELNKLMNVNIDVALNLAIKRGKVEMKRIGKSKTYRYFLPKTIKD